MRPDRSPGEQAPGTLLPPGLPIGGDRRGAAWGGAPLARPPGVGRSLRLPLPGARPCFRATGDCALRSSGHGARWLARLRARCTEGKRQIRPSWGPCSATHAPLSHAPRCVLRPPGGPPPLAPGRPDTPTALMTCLIKLSGRALQVACERAPISFPASPAAGRGFCPEPVMARGGPSGTRPGGPLCLQPLLPDTERVHQVRRPDDQQPPPLHLALQDLQRAERGQLPLRGSGGGLHAQRK